MGTTTKIHVSLDYELFMTLICVLIFSLTHWPFPGLTGPKGKPGRHGRDGDPGKPGGTFYQINGKNVSELLIPPSIAGKPNTTY